MVKEYQDPKLMFLDGKVCVCRMLVMAGGKQETQEDRLGWFLSLILR